MSIDLSPESVAAMRTHFAGQNFDATVGDICDPTLVTTLTPEEFDTVLCLNVLEHIRDDRRALDSMATLLRPRGGRLFLFVPAHPRLFGSPDVLAGHFRRYTRRGLIEAVEGAGLVVRRATYFNGLGAIPYFLNSRVLRPRSLGGHVNTQIVLFDRLAVPLLRRIERLLPMPFGQSLVVLAEAR
jgi:SAM-dependent methyltransferase